MIYGVEMYEQADEIDFTKGTMLHLLVLARNENGRKALNKLVTKSNFEYFYSKPRIPLDEFKGYENDLVVCSACLASKLSRQSDYNKCVEYVKDYKRRFPYFFLEMQSHDTLDQELYNKKILRLSKELNVPYIITTDSHSATKEDLYYQGFMVKMARDSDTADEAYSGCYLQTVEEIHEIMDKQLGFDVVEQGLKNTDLVSSLIDEVHMPFQEPKLPTYTLPEGFKSNNDYVEYLCKLGWKDKRLDGYENVEEYKERLERELNTIFQMDFSGYFLIVWDLINWAKKNGVMVGAGRGSAAGSLVCYLLGISGLDPIKYGLIFERFLNPERVGLPDIDIDLDNRGKVISYLMQKYGEDRVCQIINFNYITPLVAIKDVGKVLGFKYAEMERLSQKFRYDTFKECMEHNQSLVENNPKYAELIDIASKMSGRLKTLSCHAGGVGIVDTTISDYMGMKLGQEGEHVIQVDKRIVEEIGIVKFDLLGVATLGLVQEVEKDLNIDPWDIDINNDTFLASREPYTILNKGLTNGVFQVESAGMKDLLLRLQANSLGDISAVLALYRPDSMDALEDYIAAKNGTKVFHNFHKDLDNILSETYNCMLYQEQLMNIVRVFGNRTYGGSDLFRKAVGKKDKKLVEKESKKLYYEIIENGYDEQTAKKISDFLSTKAGYCFNQSHSYAYAVLTLQTAYLKAKYPLYFFKALFNLNKDKPGKVNKYILDAREFGIEVLPPDINKSEVNFSVYDGKILFGLSAINSIGETIAEQIVAERNKNGKFKNFTDFINRIPVKKKQIIMFIKSGAIPCKDKMTFMKQYIMSLYKASSYTIPTKLPSYNKLIIDWGIDIEKYRIGTKKYDYDKMALMKEYGQLHLDKWLNKEADRKLEYFNNNKEYLEDQPFWEFQALQIFVGKNPFEDTYKYIKADFKSVDKGEDCVVTGLISSVQKKKDKNKNNYAFINIYSCFGLIEAMVWASTLRENEQYVKKGQKVAILCKKDGEEKAIVKEIKSYDEWLEDIGRKRLNGKKV